MKAHGGFDIVTGGIPREVAPTLARLLTSAATAAFSDESSDQAVHWALRHVAELTGWPVGHAYRLDLRSGRLLPSGLWELDEPDRYADFVAETAATWFAVGRGLPGTVVRENRPHWWGGIGSDVAFERRRSARSCGLDGAFGCPIVSSHGVEGVIEFFTADAARPDDVVMDLIADVGHQVGKLLDHIRARQLLETSQAQLSMAQQLAKLGSWSWADNTGSIWSDEMFRVFDLPLTADPLTLDEIVDRIQPDDRDWAEHVLRTNFDAGTNFELDCRISTEDGSERWMTMRGEVADGSNADDVRWAGYCQDITERKQSEILNRQIQADLRNQEWVLGRIARGDPLQVTLDALCTMFEGRYPNSRCSILKVDPDDQVLRHAAGPTLPIDYRDAIDGLAVERGAGACGTSAALNEMVVVEDTLTDPLTAAFVDHAVRHGFRAIWSTPLNDTDGSVIGTFAVYHSNTHRPTPLEVQSLQAVGSLAALAIERHRTEEALTAAAQIDPLTGLLNRTMFLHHLGRRMERTGARIAVLFLDLDRFKLINDSLGHQAGDRVLVDIAERLRGVVRDDEVLARFGGDEFTLMITDATPERVDNAADRVDSALRAPFVLDTGEFFLSTSTGIAINDHETDAAGLVRDADTAMYVAKERGRARRATYDAGLRERAIERVTLESDLRRAIERNEFVLHYQPIVDLRTGAWTGVEALVRWQHPTRGLVRPDDFIPLAEDTGLIVPMGTLIIEQAIAQAAALARDGMRLEMSVNCSVVQLTDPSIATEVERMLATHGLAPSLLVIEVTETAVMTQFDLARAMLERLASLGVRIVIDDFGTGYSSIARIGDLPVVGVKIDRHFTQLLSGGADGTVFAAITNLAHAFGLQVVAEGIEDATVLERATAIGCDLGQGFHVSLPMPADELEAQLNARVSPPLT